MSRVDRAGAGVGCVARWRLYGRTSREPPTSVVGGDRVYGLGIASSSVRTQGVHTMLSSLVDRGVGFVLGSDGHKPADVRRRVPALRRFIARHDVEIVGVAQIRS